MGTSFLQMAEKVLEEEKRPLTSRGIIQIAESKGYVNPVRLWRKTSPTSLDKMILADVRDNPSSVFISCGEDPIRFILKSQLNNLRPGRKIRVLEHFYYDVDDLRIADVVATKGSIGTILNYEERSTHRMINCCTIRLDEIAPLSKDDYKNFEKHEYTSVIMVCHVGFEVILPLETFAVI